MDGPSGGRPRPRGFRILLSCVASASARGSIRTGTYQAQNATDLGLAATAGRAESTRSYFARCWSAPLPGKRTWAPPQVLVSCKLVAKRMRLDRPDTKTGTYLGPAR